MSIKFVRLNDLFNRTIKEAVQSGKLPSSKDILYKVNDTMASHDFNKPFYKFRYINKREVTNSHEYNKQLDLIHDDIDILYKRYQYSEQVLQNAVRDFNIEKSKIQHQIASLRDEIETLVSMFNNQGIQDVFFDTFNDTSKVNMANTTVAINKGASIKNLATLSTRLDIVPRTSIHTLGDSSNKIYAYGDVNNIYAPDNLKPLSYIIHSEHEGNVGLRMEIDLSKYKTPFYASLPNTDGVLLNRIEIDADTDSKVQIQYMYDDDNIFDLPYYLGLQDMQSVYSFPEIIAKKLIITFIKDKASAITTSREYEYYFNINKIQFFSYDYHENGVLESIEFETDRNINKISLSVYEETPEETSIDYYISVNDEWVPISSLEDTAPKHPQVIDLMNVEPAISKTYRISPELSKIDQELADYRWNGIKFYRLGDIEHEVVSSRLFRGKNAIKANDDYLAIDPERPQLLYEGEGPVTLKFYVFSSKGINANHTPISNMQASITMNGDVLFNTGTITPDTSITYKFLRGWNKFTITLEGKGFFDMGFNLKQYGNIYAENTPLKQVDFIDLQRVVKINDHDKYAIIDNTVVVNDYIPGIEYELIYDYVNNKVHKTKFKAVFNRNGAKTTPRLLSYYINIL